MGKQKILVVDDEQNILELISFTLNKEGYKIVSADSGDKVFHVAKRRNAGLDNT